MTDTLLTISAVAFWAVLILGIWFIISWARHT